MPIRDDSMRAEIESNPLKTDIDPALRTFLSTKAFTADKLTDNPTDALQVVNRRFVTLNGNTANRPTGSILGQSYFDTDVNKPIWWNGITFVDSTGTPV